VSNQANHKSKRGLVRPDQSIEVSSFEGIIPDPATLAELEKLHPGSTKMWMELAASEIKSRQINESRITWTFKYSSIIGLILGFLSTVVVCAVGAYAIYKDQANAGAVIITGSAATVITAFIVRGVRGKNN
jgi:uncharacterized membrane protein